MSTSQSELGRVATWLKGVPFCDGLDADELTAIAVRMHERPFAAGETLASAGDEVTEFWIVVEGELESFVTDARGRESLLGTIRQGETVGEVVILEKTSLRPVRFAARTNGTLLVAPATALLDWVEAYPQLMKTLFRTLSGRFRQVTGLSSRSIPSPRLEIVSGSPRGFVLIGRLVSRLLGVGERLRVWADQPTLLKAAGTWPEALPVDELASVGEALMQRGSSDSDRRIVVRACGSDDEIDVARPADCDEVLWLVEPREAARKTIAVKGARNEIKRGRQARSTAGRGSRARNGRRSFEIGFFTAGQ